MSTSLKIAASRAQDLYFQDYAPRDAFFDIEDFKWHFAIVYSDLFNQLFQQVRKENKLQDGFSNVEMTAAWLVREKLEPQAEEDGCLFYVQPTSCIFGFGFDSFSYSLDRIRAIGNCPGGIPCKVVKISSDESQFLDISPVTSLVYAWATAENKIALTAKIPVEVDYVPEVDATNDNCVLSDNIVNMVIVKTLDMYFKARNGTFVDETNDSNKTVVPELQANPTLSKIQRS